VPVWQRLPPGLQPPPAVQATQVPALQTWLVPQAVPSATLVRPVQVSAPLVHDVVPTWQLLPLALHDWPDEQATHCPELHTRLVPHDVPSGWLAVKAHVCVPVAQVVVPFWQVLPPGLHDVPAAQLTHVPLLHTWSVPHVMPFDAGRGLVQVAVPVAQEVVPVRQTLPLGVQLVPAVQSVQVPPLHTLLVPHDVPSATFAELMHVELPDEQSVVPVRQTLPPGLHDAPAVQAPQLPLLHTWPEPHGVPPGATPFCVQTPVPELQSM
jgi:hypothetical protein